MSKSTKMAVISLFFMFLSLIIMAAPEVVLAISLVVWLSFGAYSAVIFIREKRRKGEECSEE